MSVANPEMYQWNPSVHCALYMFAIKPHIYVALTLKILFCNALYLIVSYCITLYCIEWIISRTTSNHSTLYSVDS